MAKKLARRKAKPGNSGGELGLKTRTGLYSARRFINDSIEKEIGLRIPFDVYYKDPLVAKTVPGLDIDREFFVPWEPGIADGPTSARFAVVDYDSTTEKLQEPAIWKGNDNSFVDGKGRKVDSANKNTPQFRQVSTWAILQHTLDFFESGHGLGRRILWGFEGNRLIVVPQAGVGQNAYYDRKSKSLQFYYFPNDRGRRVYTCLSSDIVNHEFGHAVLDGIRPHFLEAVSPETGAFHEFLGDLTAILMTLRNRSFREALAAQTKGDLAGNNILSGLAAEFGDAVEGRPYLRTAANEETMESLAGELRPHTLSQVMTGAMFDIVTALTKQYLARETPSGRAVSVARALANTTQRMQQVAVQALDFLPPVEATFRDYALAVLRNVQLSDPLDLKKYRGMIIKVFKARGILSPKDERELARPSPLIERAPGSIFHDIAMIAGSRAEAYRYLDDNRDELFIPDNADIVVSEIFTADKLWIGIRLPKQILVQYLWREELLLKGRRFGAFDGNTTSLLCGATLVLDQNGSLLHWARKPGAEPTATALRAMEKRRSDKKLTGVETRALEEMNRGIARRKAYLDALARRIEAGMIGDEIGGSMGLLGRATPPLTSRTVDGSVRFELSPHFAIDEDEDDMMGGRQWQVSS